MWYVGVDLHKRVAELVGLDGETGEIRELGQCGPTAEALHGKMESLGQVSLIVIEAVNGSGKVYQGLEALGYRVSLVAGTVVDKMRVGQRDKTDRADAELLARFGLQLDQGLSQEQVWPVEEQIRSLGQLTRVRARLVGQRTGIVDLLHATLPGQGIAIAKGKLNTGANRRLLGHLVLPGEAALAVRVLLEMLEKLNGVLAEVEERLKQLARGEEAIRRLYTLPGVGAVLGATLYAEIGDLGRFASKSRLRAYAGLVPRLRQSSGYPRHGPLRRACNHHLKTALVQAANIISRMKGSSLQHYWWQKFHQHGRVAMVANVATARKLLGIVWALWRDRTVYQEPLQQPVTAGGAS